MNRTNRSVAASHHRRQLNQQRYRDRKRRKQMAMESRVLELRAQIMRMVWFKGLLAEGMLLRPTEILRVRGVLLQMYADYFRYGAQQTTGVYAKQAMFLRQNCDPNMTLDSLAVQNGYQTLLYQWEL